MKGFDRLRRMIAREAARLMYEEGVREYRDAKRKAAKRFGPEKALSLGSHLPSNAEIHQELHRLIKCYEKDVLPQRLLKLRLIALKWMEFFSSFSPYLVGSVLSGVVTERSDIDIHLFAEDPEEVESFLGERNIAFEIEVISVRKGGKMHDYPHIYLKDSEIEVECSIYPRVERHHVPKSSITGKPMIRADAKKLRKIIEKSL